MPLDTAAITALADLPQVAVSAAAHAQEHSLEVHLPFLQTVLGEFRLLPLAVGDATPGEVAEVLARVWGGPETLIVISSDLSHYLPYEVAQRTDSETVRHILGLHADLDHDAGMRRHTGKRPAGLCRRSRLDRRTAGPAQFGRHGRRQVARGGLYRDRLPRGGSVNRLPDAQGAILLVVARDAIAQRLGSAGVDHDLQDWLQEPGASFVTLTQQGALRGCIGSLAAQRPLLEDVRANAVAAALHDPRFPPLQAVELPRTRIEVSLLSAAEDMDVESEADAIAQLRPGIDGVVLRLGQARGTFLPQVWESLPRPEDFLLQLKRKAGLPGDFWDEDIRLARYTVSKWQEAERT